MLQPTPVIVAAAAPFDRDVERGLGRIERILGDARALGAGLVVLPESALGGYIPEPGPGESAPDLPAGLDPDGPEIARLVAMAGDLVVCAGAIVARWAAREGAQLHTFAVGTDGSPDLIAARTVAEHLGTDHHEIDYRAAEALESLPNVVRSIESFDPGLVRSAVPNYMLARMTRQHVRVVLTGEGADELFAGYDYLREFTDPSGCTKSSSGRCARCTTSTCSAATA